MVNLSSFKYPGSQTSSHNYDIMTAIELAMFIVNVFFYFLKLLRH